MAEGFVITPVHDLLLRGTDTVQVGLYHLHLATAEQLCRLHYRPGMLNTVKARLKTLAKHGYVQPDAIPTKQGRSPYYYTLGSKGLRYLRGLGFEIPPSLRASKETDKSYTHIMHTQEVNDVLIAAALLGKTEPGYRLERFIHERILKQPQYRYVVVPDGFLYFALQLPDGRTRHLSVLLEHDRAQEHKLAFTQRIRGYMKMLRTEAQKQLYGVSKVAIAFTTFAGQDRVEDMRQWTKKELAARNAAALGQYFFYASLTKPLDPREVWLGLCWRTLYTDEPVSLLAR